jgi:Protein of unknown function (DUF2490)
MRWTTRCSQAVVVLLMVASHLPARAQVEQFLPEIDSYVGINANSQFWFQAKQTREDDEPTQAEIGPSFDFFFKPVVKLNSATVFDLDKSKNRLLVVSMGYRFLPSPGAPSENRILLMATSNLPFKGSLLISDRNRLEINFTNGNNYWRYRNRVTLQRTIALHSYHPSLNASAEAYYNSRYEKWSTTAIYAGAIFPIGKKVELNPYYEHQNSTGASPNQQINALGLILNVFFRSHN